MAILSVAIGFFLFCEIAQAHNVVCGPGEDAAQCNAPSAVAVDNDDGLLYVADKGNLRVDVFLGDGTFLRAFGWDVSPEGAPGDTPGDQLEVCTTVCKQGSAGGGGGQFASLSGIAVDNDPASTAQHDVYVLDESLRRVQRFHSNGEFVLTFGAPGVGTGEIASSAHIAIGPGGAVHVADNIGGGDRRVQRFTHEGSILTGCPSLPPGNFGEALKGFGVNAAGDFYLVNGGETGAVRKYDSACNLLNTFHQSFSINTLATDVDGDLFIGDPSGQVGLTSVYAYDPSTVLKQVLYGDGTLQDRSIALAPYEGATGDLFTVEGTTFGGLGRVVHIDFPPPGPVVYPDPDQTEADPIRSTRAKLNTWINPEGKATNYRFQYVDDATYQDEGFDNPQETETSAVVPGGSPTFAPDLFRLSPASTEVGCPKPSQQLIDEGKCLFPETIYHFRVVATNADLPPDEERMGPEVEFETGPPFEILGLWSSKVGVDAATLHAQVNPLASGLTGHFEYVDEETFEESGFVAATQLPATNFGSGEIPVTRSVQLSLLTPGTSYRYRILVENPFGFEGEEEGAFTTYRLAEPSLPCPNDQFRSGTSALLPDCRAYEMVSPVDKEGGDILAPFTLTEGRAEVVQSAATVPADGRGFVYSAIQSFGHPVSAPYASQYIASRRPLGHPEVGWRSESASPPREGAAFYSLPAFETQFKLFSEDLRLGWLRSDSEPPLTEDAIPGYSNLYERDGDIGAYKAICPTEPPNEKAGAYLPKQQGRAADGSLIVFRANDKLTNDASGAKVGGARISQVYGCSEGQLKLISVLPPALGGDASNGNSSLGTNLGQNPDHRHDSVHNAVSANGVRVYWTDIGDNSVGSGRLYLRENPMSGETECAASPTAPCTVAVSEAVPGAGPNDRAHFWTASPDGSVAIFSFTAGPLAGNLYEFDAESKTSTPIEEGVSGLAGWSEDASRLYVASTKALAPETQEGKVNLYFHDAADAGNFDLVAADVAGFCFTEMTDPRKRCTRATANGLNLAFMSRSSLTAYDNTDSLSGKASDEVYLYDASANGGGGALHCVSCNPSQARPTARMLAGGSGTTSAVAARIPAWENSFYAPRILSEDGRRLFFESYDALILGDTNGVQDVYQWQEADKGDCDVEDHNYFADNGGCLSLISSGRNERDSEFVDASTDGSDVFIRTAASLLPQDPGLLDIYDARVEGGFPSPVPPKPPCEGEACQSPPPPPQAPTPSSSSFDGSGDPKTGGKPVRCPKGKRLSHRGGKARCVKKQGRGEKKRRKAQRDGGERR